MKTRLLAILLALGVVVFVGVFMSAALRPPAMGSGQVTGGQPTASVTEALSDGRLEVQVYALGDLGVRLEIQFAPDADRVDAAGMQPDANFAMLNMHMDGFETPLEVVGPGKWRAQFKVPMEGRWVVSVGFGEDRAEVEFDAN